MTDTTVRNGYTIGKNFQLSRSYSFFSKLDTGRQQRDFFGIAEGLTHI